MRLGRFQLRERVATGGQGQVWTAVHVDLGAPAACKVLLPRYAGDPAARAWFANEVRAVARLDHPRIVAVFDFGEVTADQARAADGALAAGAPWLVTEWLGGGSLSGRPPLDEVDAVADLAGQLLDGLAHAHARGVLHLDLKPGNVLTVAGSPDTVRIVDFGIARLDGGSGPAMGTPGWAAPEQLRGRGIGPWSDLYAVGRLVASRATPRVRERLGDWLDRATHPEPDHRFRSCAEAWAALPAASRRRRRPPPRIVPALGVALLPLRAPPLVGRAAELRALRAAHRAARLAAGACLLAVIRGPRGSGRSALAQAFAAQVRETGVDDVAVIDDADSAPPPPALVGPRAPGPSLGPGLLPAESRATSTDGGARLVVAVVTAGLPPDWPAPDTEVVLGRLAPRTLRAAVSTWLPLRAQTLELLLALADGWVGRARNTLAEWVAAGALTYTPGGYARTAGGAPARLPDPVRPHLRALAAAALLGERLGAADWEAAADAAGVSARQVAAARAAATGAGLWVEVEGELRFRSPEARFAVLDELGPELSAVAAAVAGHAAPPAGAMAVALRGRPGAALATIAEASLAAMRRNRFEEAWALQRELDHVAARHPVGDADPGLLRGLAHRALLLTANRDPAEVRAVADQVLTRALPANRPDDASIACFALGRAWFALDLAEATRWLDRAFGLAVDPACRARAAGLYAQSLIRARRAEDAIPLLDALLAEGVADRWLSSEVAFARGLAARHTGDRDGARRWFLASLDGDHPNPTALAFLALELEEDGRFDDARRLHERSLAGTGSTDRLWAMLCRSNLARLELRRGNVEACRREIRAAWDTDGAPPYPASAFFQVLVAACAADADDLAGFDEAFGVFAEAHEDVRRSPDYAFVLEGLSRRFSADPARRAAVEAATAVRSTPLPARTRR